jgi:acyl-CoA synthetase (NDP forming)
MRGRRLAVLSRSGGHAVITADACSQYGFDLVPFPESFFERLNTLYTRRVIAPQNPLDLGEIFDYRIYARILEEALKLDCVDGALFNHVYQSHYESDMSRTFLGELDSLVRKYNKPAAVAVITDAAETMEILKSFPVYTSPLAAIKALHISATYAERKRLRDTRGEGAAFPFPRHPCRNAWPPHRGKTPSPGRRMYRPVGGGWFEFYPEHQNKTDRGSGGWGDFFPRGGEAPVEPGVSQVGCRRGPVEPA